MTKFLPWWSNFGAEIALEHLKSTRAQAFVRLADRAADGVVSVKSARRGHNGHEGVLVEIRTGKPQKPVVPLAAREPMMLLFDPGDVLQPGVFAMRADFPRTLHQNSVPRGFPASLCIDDRPWVETRRTWAPSEMLRRTLIWFERAAMGALHDTGQPLDPFFAGASWQVVLPKEAFEDGKDLSEVIAYQRDPRSGVVVAAANEADIPRSGGLAVCFVSYAPLPAPMEALRRCPETLGALADDLAGVGIDLFGDLAKRTVLWSNDAAGKASSLNARLGIIVHLSVLDPSGAPARREDPFVFWTLLSAGQIGMMLGRLLPGVVSGFATNLQSTAPDLPQLRSLRIETGVAHMEFTRQRAAVMAGRSEPDDRKVVLVGAGAIGSVMADILAREGRFSWDIFDDDVLLPHNVAKHALTRSEVGISKADGLASRITALAGGTSVEGHRTNTLSDGAGEAFAERVGRADIVIDASASVSTARALCDLPGAARRISAFFNPAGYDVVVLGEDAERQVDLRTLESAYYRAILYEPRLADHLTKTAGQLRYSGSCRAVTNRIPASRASTLSSIAAVATARAVDANAPLGAVWMLRDDGAVERISVDTSGAVKLTAREWSIFLLKPVYQTLLALRREALPSETGGVVLGVIDLESKRIDVVDILRAPSDSKGTPSSFVRGVAGLKEEIVAAQAKTLDQIRYLGEWHSHPSGYGTAPSLIDVCQIARLADALFEDGYPGLMLIVGDAAISPVIGETKELTADSGGETQ